MERKCAEGFIPYWASRPRDQPEWVIDKMNETRKTVFTKTLETSPWLKANVVLAHGDLADEIDALKHQAGGDLIAYGGATFVSGLIGRGLIDELHLLVNPIALGSGMTVFAERGAFDLAGAAPFPCGIVVLHYRPKMQAGRR